MADCMTPELLAEWQAFDQLEPFGPAINSADFKAFIVNMVRQVMSSLAGAEDQQPPATAADFLFGWHNRRAKSKTKDIGQKILQHFAVLGKLKHGSSAND